MTELLRFYPDGKHLYIEFLASKYIDVQPSNDFEMQMLLERIRPIVKQLDDFVEQHNLKEVIEINLKDVPVAKLNADMAIGMMNLCSTIRPDKNIVEKVVITNSNPVFRMIYKSVQGNINPGFTEIITFESNSKFE